MEDSTLIHRYLKGDASAFNTLVWRWEQRIFNLALKYLGDREMAQDVSQKTFIRAYKNLRKLRRADRFAPWIYQIAVNLCRDELRRQKSNGTISLDASIAGKDGKSISLSESLPDTGKPTDGRAQEADIAGLINAALSMIPEEQRVVIVMKEYQGLTFAEIAEILQQPLNTIKSRLYYGLTAMRKAFKSMDVEEEVYQNEV